ANSSQSLYIDKAISPLNGKPLLRTTDYGLRTTDQLKMCDEWMPVVELPLTLEQFHQLPRNPAYKYELIGGKAYLSPRPKHFHAQLDLAWFGAETAKLRDTTSIRPLVETDWPGLE